MRTSAGNVAAFAVIVSAIVLDAQSPKPRFEVASVRQHLNGGLGYSNHPRPGGAYDAGNVPLRVLIEFGYEIPTYQLVGGPGWLDTHRFDIAARAGRDVPLTEVRLMMQSLLEERFKLVVRREQREMPHFALVKARSDGRLGPGLKRLGEICGAAKASQPEADAPADKPWVARSGTLERPCGAPISGIASLASKVMEMPVVDRTGLEGGWDFALGFGSTLGQSFGSLTAGQNAASDPNSVSFTTALEEQLGLRLESTRGPVEVLVIDSVQLPTEN
jgi:bla regulator protein blaR1